jgi:large conductance mechanosensitive channel
MFLVVKGMNRIHRHFVVEDAARVPELSPTDKLLTEIRDLLKDRQ